MFDIGIEHFQSAPTRTEIDFNIVESATLKSVLIKLLLIHTSDFISEKNFYEEPSNALRCSGL